MTILLPHAVYIVFIFALGACVGSFLNVVVWRLPRDESLISPPSHCPRCNTPLAWYDNLPVIGWIKLAGKCRYCREPISIRYPIVEAVTGLLFVFYYVMFFVLQHGPVAELPQLNVDLASGTFVPRPLDITLDWPMFGLYLFLIAALLAASLIDAELFIIPVGIPWLTAVLGLVVHTLIDSPRVPGALTLSAGTAALAAGGSVGLAISMGLWRVGVLPQSFPDGEPLLEIDREAIAEENKQAAAEGRAQEPLPTVMTRTQIFAEIRKEMLFLMPPMLLAALWCLVTLRVPAIKAAWGNFSTQPYISGFLGAAFGAMIGALVVWLTRILGTLGFGRVAMGLGDVHLMFGVGAVIGAGAATVAFFLAPFFGILVAVYFLLTRTRRELPYGPYLSMATGLVMIFYAPIAAYLTPGFQGLGIVVANLTQHLIH
jgi:leader peptidase (prepilin peptidase)/N-methyltransferase